MRDSRRHRVDNSTSPPIKRYGQHHGIEDKTYDEGVGEESHHKIDRVLRNIGRVIDPGVESLRTSDGLSSHREPSDRPCHVNREVLVMRAPSALRCGLSIRREVTYSYRE